MNTPTTKAWYNEIYKEWGLLVTEDWCFPNVNGGYHTVPSGFWYNGGSIPAIFWQLTYDPYHPILLAPTLAHDWAYCSHCMSRSDADDTLRYLLGCMKASSLKSAAIKSAVHVFGESFYERDRKDFLYLSVLRSQIVESGRSLAKYGI